MLIALRVEADFYQTHCRTYCTVVGFPGGKVRRYGIVNQARHDDLDGAWAREAGWEGSYAEVVRRLYAALPATERRVSAPVPPEGGRGESAQIEGQLRLDLPE